MTLFTFNQNYDKLIDETKLQSIRHNAEYWISRLEKNPKLDIWWLSPRNQHPDCRKLGIATGYATPVYGYEFTAATAMDDGYSALSELFKVLMDLHNIDYDGVLAHRWASIRWTWTERYGLNGERLKTSVQTTL